MAVNFNQDSVWNLKQIKVDSVKKEVTALLINGEEVEMAFQTVRDQLVFTGICRNGWFSVRKRVVGEYSLCEKRWFSIESHLFLCYTRLIKSIRKKVVINLPSYPK